jgi:hypothetical protein
MLIKSELPWNSCGPDVRLKQRDLGQILLPLPARIICVYKSGDIQFVNNLFRF